MFPVFGDDIMLWWADLVTFHRTLAVSILKVKLNSGLMPISAVPDFRVVGNSAF
jgi:hypothetical protein